MSLTVGCTADTIGCQELADLAVANSGTLCNPLLSRG